MPLVVTDDKMPTSYGIDKKENLMSAKTITITVTGAAGQIAYSLLPRLGDLLVDVDTKIILKLLDIEPAMPMLQAVAMELEDCAMSWLSQVVITSDEKTAFEGCQLALLIGASPRKKGMERADLLRVNGAIFQSHGDAINQYAANDVRVLVVGNPCNTNAYICMNHARDVPSHRFYSLSMLDQNRACAHLAKQFSLDISLIENLCVWGNHSLSMYVDYERALYDGKPLIEQVDQAWLANDYQTLVAQRGGAVIAARGASSAASAANAVLDASIMLLDATLVYGAFSMGVCSHGEYGARPGTIVSYPCQYDSKGNLAVVEHIELDAVAQKRISASFDEIAAEADLCRSLDLILSD